MNNTMEYKGYVGSVEFSEEDGLFYGKVMGIRALISYEGSTAADLVNDFHGAVDDYLALCEENHTEPERAYKRHSTSWGSSAWARPSSSFAVNISVSSRSV